MKVNPKAPNDGNQAHFIKLPPPRFPAGKNVLLSQIPPVGSKSVWVVGVTSAILKRHICYVNVRIY
uniref:DUF5641 domain-containing protein n=1 Tax=Heterorhabditis bacteriophora TaxID=37862 RepID=A0A1I7X8U4_HETBA